MPAVSIDHFGPVEDLRVVQKPDPDVTQDEVLIQVVSSTINPVDDKTRNGDIEDSTRPFPVILGWDPAGVVVDDPTGRFIPGDRVIG